MSRQGGRTTLDAGPVAAQKVIDEIMNRYGCGVYSREGAHECTNLIYDKLLELEKDPNHSESQYNDMMQDVTTILRMRQVINATPTGGKTRRRKNVIGELKEGKLTSLGYSPIKKSKTRRAALRKAVIRYGRVSTLRKVNAVAVLTKRRAPKTSKTYKSDVKYLQKKYF